MPRTEIIKKEIYKFDELSKEAKEKALENIRCSDYMDYGWWDGTLEEFKDDCDKIGIDIETNEIEFNLDRGASFGLSNNGISINDNYIKKELKLKKKPYVDVKFNVRKIGYYHVEFPSMGWHQSDSNSDGWYEVIIEDANESNKKRIETLVGEMISKLCDLCNEYYHKLENEYEYMGSDEYIIEMIEANDWEFSADGSRA